MIWCRIKKRKGNAYLYGYDLGAESPRITVTVDKYDGPPKPKLPKKWLSNGIIAKTNYTINGET